MDDTLFKKLHLSVVETVYDNIKTRIVCVQWIE